MSAHTAAGTLPRIAGRTNPPWKVYENLQRRRASRQGLELRRVRRRDRRAADFGLYWLERDGVPLFGDHRMTLEDVERYLTGGQP